MNNLIVKYAITGAVLAPAGVFLAGFLGMNMAMGYVSFKYFTQKSFFYTD